jgi:hypothetical protein
MCLYGRTSDVGDEGKREGFGRFYTPREKKRKVKGKCIAIFLQYGYC